MQMQATTAAATAAAAAAISAIAIAVVTATAGAVKSPPRLPPPPWNQAGRKPAPAARSAIPR